MVWAVPRAPYASNPEQSRGRLHPEPEHEMRSPFQRDRDRIIHSSAFRRLKHKTQVFVAPDRKHPDSHLGGGCRPKLSPCSSLFDRSLKEMVGVPLEGSDSCRLVGLK